jgi:repressor LexA
VQEPLTDKQAAVLDFLRRRADRGEPPPTNREICTEFGWSSTRSARDHLRALARKHYVELSGGRSHRRVRLLEEPAAVARVPVVGRVVAGVPVEAVENVEGCLPVPAEWIGEGTYFAVRVEGDSMKDAGIFEGDVVVARKQATAEDGDIVVAMLDGETTLKRVRQHRRCATLVAENRRYRSIRVRTESAEIQGVVVGLMRAFRPSRGWHYHRLASPIHALSSHEGRRHAYRA